MAVECEAPADCGNGHRVQQCSDCGSGQCKCWYKREGADDVDCVACNCDQAQTAVAQWCSTATVRDDGLGVGYGCGCGAGFGAPVLLALLLVLRRRR